MHIVVQPESLLSTTAFFFGRSFQLGLVLLFFAFLFCPRMNNDLLQTRPLVHFVKVKKTNRKFNRFQSDRFKRVSSSWRKPKGIDNPVRKRLRGYMAMPSVGYKGDALVRHLLPNGFRKVIITTVKDLEALTSLNRVYCGEISRRVGAKKRAVIVRRAAELGIVLANGTAKLIPEKMD